MATQTHAIDRSKRGISYRGKSFYDQDFSNRDLTRDDFRGCTLIGCNFDNSDLSYTNMEGANLDGASFRQTRLYRTNLKDACLARTIMDPRDMFGVTVTLHCAQGMKMGKLWAASWLQILLICDMPEEQRKAIRAAGDSLVGPERMDGIARAFNRREL